MVRFLATTELRYCPDKAERVMGWRAQVPIDEGIKLMVDWAKTQHA